MASHTQDDGFHEIQLNGKQLVFVFMAATVVSVVIFLCGVLVGRGARVESSETVRMAEPSAVEQLRNSVDPVKPPTVQQSEDPTKALPPTPAEGGTSGQDTPAMVNSAGPGDAPAAATARAETTVARSAPPERPMVAAPRTPAGSSVASAPKPASVPAAAPAPAAASAPVRVAPAPERTTAAAKTEPARPEALRPAATRPGAARVDAAKVEAAKTEDATLAAVKSPPPAAAGSLPAPDDRQGWMVQVAATKTRSEADTIMKRLTSKGYAAFVLTNQPNVFRVRVGGYKSRRDADTIAARLRQEEHVTPWVTR